MKKIGNLILSLLLIVSMFPMTVVAEVMVDDSKNIESSTIKSVEEVEFLEDISNEETAVEDKNGEIQTQEENTTSENKDEQQLEKTEDTIIRNEIDISDLTEEELQYVPEGLRDEDVIVEEIPQLILDEEYGPRARSAYPDVNNYIRQKGWNVPNVKYDYKSQFTKFQYRNFRPEGVVAHETANPNSTIHGEINYMIRNHKNAFVHAFVDHNNIIEIHPIGLGAWGAGHIANQRFIHVELVRVHSFDQFAKSMNNYADYIAYLLYQSGLPVTSAESSGKGTLWSHAAVTKHLGGTTHGDPHGYFRQYGYSWAQFVQLVKERHKQYVDGGTVKQISNPKKLFSEEKKVSRLGQIKSSNRKIYRKVGNDKSAFNAGDTYTKRVFYIKNSVLHNGDTYYLLATSPSATKNTVGWIKSKDVTTYTHKGIDKKKKTFHLKGSGIAYNRAWGGTKNRVYNSLSSMKDEVFNVSLTESVGNNVWYRGSLAGKTVWIHENHLIERYDSPTSRLGQVKSKDTILYKELGDKNSSFKAGETYFNSVYYIKRVVKERGKTFYLLSTRPSSTEGLIGWVESKDITSYTHQSVDSKSKSFYFKGTGVAYNRAWGGRNNLIHTSLDKYFGEEFKVHLTEKVGNNTWYRGDFNNQRIWVHESHLSVVPVKDVAFKRDTSRLGQINNENVMLKKDLIKNSSEFKAGKEYTDAVFYIKEEAEFNREKYYHLSTKPSNKEGTFGWIKAKDITTYSHKGVDRKEKTFYLKGKGVAYNRAWGGHDNLVHKELKSLQDEEFHVNLTETVGGNVWYRGKLQGQTVWIHSSHVESRNIHKKSTSRLGQVKSKSVSFYASPGARKVKLIAGQDYYNHVFYIKEEATVNDKRYFLMSKRPSAKDGLIGWIEEKDVITHSHKGIDSKKKTFYLKGKGVAYNRAWGGRENLVFNNLELLRDEVFKVELTEAVGGNIWYRGILDGKRVWIHSSHLEERNINTRSTSRLGQVKNKDVIIQKEIANRQTAFQAGEAYFGSVFYIKQQASYNGDTYYLISARPSSSEGVIGWVKSNDIITHTHKGVDRKPKTLYLKGKGVAYNRAWGGRKNLVHSELKSLEGAILKVNLTETVGNNIWYRGNLNGKTVWIHSSHLSEK